MGGPRLTPEQIEKRLKEKLRKSLLFQRIRQLFSHQEIKELLKHFTSTISSYLIANVSNLVGWLYDDEGIDPINQTDNEFKRKIVEDVTANIDDKVQVIEIINVEDDTGLFPKTEQEEMKIEQTPQLPKKWNIMKILNYHQKK
jgi:hypothetical protein